MAKRKLGPVSGLIAAVVLCGASAEAQDKQPAAPPRCSIDLNKPGHMKDIVSNALLQGMHKPEKDVQAFLLDAEEKYMTGPALLKAAAARFAIDEAILASEVEKYRHINCQHEPVEGHVAPPPKPVDDGLPVSAFAKNVTLHVVLHELGHALIREFDIPILTNEETAADAFATYYLTTYLPERAPDVLAARVTSLMIEARELPQPGWSGEHDHDARRANQIAALAMAADPLKYKGVGAIVGMSEDDIEDARDYGAEIHRSWRRVLGPLWMPEGTASSEARVLYNPEIGFIDRLCADGLAAEIEAAIKRFDWHSRVTVQFVEGEGKAGWSRSGRNITVNSAYVRRFIGQGERRLPAVEAKP